MKRFVSIPILLALMLGGCGLAYAALNLLKRTGIAAFASLPVWIYAMVIMFGINALLVLVAWAVHGRDQMGVGTILRLPLYLLWKLPIYLRLIRGGETRWIRTERE